jgi:hypothetical protein
MGAFLSRVGLFPLLIVLGSLNAHAEDRVVKRTFTEHGTVVFSACNKENCLPIGKVSEYSVSAIHQYLMDQKKYDWKELGIGADCGAGAAVGVMIAPPIWPARVIGGGVGCVLGSLGLSLVSDPWADAKMNAADLIQKALNQEYIAVDPLGFANILYDRLPKSAVRVNSAPQIAGGVGKRASSMESGGGLASNKDILGAAAD